MNIGQDGSGLRERISQRWLDVYDLFWQWANKSLDSDLTIPSEIYDAVIALPRQDRHFRAKVNAAVTRKQRESRSNKVLRFQWLGSA